MASNKDKAFALFYAVAVATVTVTVTATATAIIVVIATNQAGIESIANLGLLRLQLKEKHSLFNYKC